MCQAKKEISFLHAVSPPATQLRHRDIIPFPMLLRCIYFSKYQLSIKAEVLLKKPKKTKPKNQNKTNPKPTKQQPPLKTPSKTKKTHKNKNQTTKPHRVTLEKHLYVFFVFLELP